MDRPPIEGYLRYVKLCCGDKPFKRWCDTWSCKSMKEVCDYALALETRIEYWKQKLIEEEDESVALHERIEVLEKEKVELERKALGLIELAFESGRAFQRNLDRGIVQRTSDQILKDLVQELKEES